MFEKLADDQSCMRYTKYHTNKRRNRNVYVFKLHIFCCHFYTAFLSLLFLVVKLDLTQNVRCYIKCLNPRKSLVISKNESKKWFFVLFFLLNKIFIFDEHLVVFDKHSNKMQKKKHCEKQLKITLSIVKHSYDPAALKLTIFLRWTLIP